MRYLLILSTILFQNVQAQLTENPQKVESQHSPTPRTHHIPEQLPPSLQNSVYHDPLDPYRDLEEIFYHLQQQDLQELKSLSTIRKEMLEKREAALKAQKEGILRVAIFGNSALDYTKNGFNEVALQLLFDELKIKEPQAIFFIGPLIESNFPLEPFYNKLKQLAGDIPVYPTPDSPEIVEKYNLPVSKEFPKGYTVFLKNTLFALFSKPNEDEEGFLKWIETTLQEHPGSYRFMLGPTAAFSTLATEGYYAGLDRWMLFRNKFWNLLRSGNVLAYFAGNEVLYDRSYRSGLWQILTGGGGATRSYNEKDDTFYHFVLLTVPIDGKGPSLEVYDIRGRRRDHLHLSFKAPAISQFRISISNN